jgi:outer membrane protein TolC
MAQCLLTLEESIVKAKELSLGIDVEEQNIRKRSFDIKKARADTLPVLSLNYDYEHLLGIHTLKDSVDLSWDLSAIAKGSGRPQELMLRAAEKKKSMVEALLAYQVKAGYYKLMQLKQELIVLQKGRELLNQQRSITVQLVSAQLKLDSALSRIDDQINTIKNQILIKQGVVDQTRSALLQMLNIPDPDGIKFVDCKKEFIPLPDRSLVMSNAPGKAPEIQSMIFEQQALTESVHSPWMDMLPVVTVSAGYQQEWPIANNEFDFHMVLSIPLLDMGRARYVNAGNAALAAKKQAEIRQKTKALVDRISILYGKAELSRTLFMEYKKTYAHRLQTLQLTKSEYGSGLVSESDFINTQRNAIDAEFQMNKAFYDYMTFVAEIDYRRGGVK